MDKLETFKILKTFSVAVVILLRDTSYMDQCFFCIAFFKCFDFAPACAKKIRLVTGASLKPKSKMTKPALSEALLSALHQTHTHTHTSIAL